MIPRMTNSAVLWSACAELAIGWAVLNLLGLVR
jgi:hypothetical protein